MSIVLQYYGYIALAWLYVAVYNMVVVVVRIASMYGYITYANAEYVCIAITPDSCPLASVGCKNA